MADQILAYKFRAYPNAAQRRALEGQLSEACRLYNAALQERRDAWTMCRKRVSLRDQDRQLKHIRADGDIGISSFGSARDVLIRVEMAFEGFFRRVRVGQKPGFPRFKSRARYDSLSAPIRNGMFLRGDRLHILGVGPVRFTFHRPIVGDVTNALVKRDGRKWFVVLTAQAPSSAMPSNASSIGLDVGLASFVASSDSTTVVAPKHLRSAQAQLHRAQRHLARCRRNSRRRKHAIERVRSIHVAVRNRRADFTHKLSRQIVNAHGRIAVEKLNIKGMARGHFAKSIHDAGWRLFLNQLRYKAASAGREFVEVNAAGTSQTCLCGVVVAKTLKDRWHSCPDCGLSGPRDVVSAMVIEARGRRVQTRTGPLGAVVCEAAS